MPADRTDEDMYHPVGLQQMLNLCTMLAVVTCTVGEVKGKILTNTSTRIGVRLLTTVECSVPQVHREPAAVLLIQFVG